MESSALEPTETDAPAIGRRIARARHEAGWMTQKTLAELLCVCKRSVQSYEAGATIPYRHLHRLAEIFERPASWFLYGDEGARGDGEAPDRDAEILDRLDAHERALKALATEMRTLRKAVYAVGSHLTDTTKAAS